MKKTLLLLALFVLTVVSCVKAPISTPIEPNPEIGSTIPDNFDWKTIKEIKVTVNVTEVDAQSKDKLHIIKIYNSPLLSSASLIVS
ncbi:MAG: hypothetical protein PHE99_07630, partial [Bacteroidales bacterium]|nr:hypothetical protein [Bacteroidales bacterium]